MDILSNLLDSGSVKSPYLWIGLLAGPVYVIYTVIWRLYFSPIAHFPGPKLAAATSLYEAYYNIWLGGKYIWRVKQMHDTYGPIVRISPTELHVLDPEFFETLYPSSTSKRKAHKVSKFFGLEDSLFSTIDHDLHRMRRTALLPFFSTAYTRKLQPDIQERLGVMLTRMKGFKDTNEPINASCMYAAFTNDIMQILAFGECAYKLETPGFDSTERDASISGAMAYHVLKRILWFNNLLMVVPESIVEKINPSLGSYMRQKRRTREQVEKLATQTSDDWASRGIAPVFQAVRESSKLPPQEKSIDRLAQDAQMLLMAGTLTTASTLEHMTYWLLDNPIVLRKLKDELITVMPSIDDVGKIPLSTLDSLPYLTAIIKEGARLIYGNSLPHFRQNPDGTLTLTDKERGKTWVIPAGTSVGMTSVLLHHNEDHFPDSYDFVPERWLGEEGKKLEKYMVAFGKGGRICLGMNQAFGILRLVLAQMWRSWASEDVKIGDEIGKITLYNTTAEDVEVVGDFFIAAYHKPQGVEFKVHSV